MVKKKTIRTKILSTLLLLFLIFIAVTAFFLPPYLNELLEDKLIQEFNKQSEHNYELTFSDLNIGLISRSITINSIAVLPDNTSRNRQQITATSISINGISWLSLLSNPFPTFRSITIIEPDVHIHKSDLFSKLIKNSSDLNSTDSGQALSDTSDTKIELSLFDLFIKNGKTTIINDRGESFISINDLSLEASEVDINKLMDGADLLIMDKLTIQGSDLLWKVETDFYDITIGNFIFNKLDDSLNLSDVTYHPVLPKYEFSIAKGFQLDRYDLKIPEIDITGMDISTLNNRHIDISEISIIDPWFEVFRNKQITRRSGKVLKPLLNELAQSIDFSIGVDQITISNGTIIYEEHNPPFESSGSISFNDIHATLNHLRTATHPFFSTDTLTLHVKSNFMDVSPLLLDVSYPVFRSDNRHTLQLKLDKIDPKVVGGILEKSGFVRIEEGMVESLNTQITLTSDVSRGQLILLYNGLKISMLNKGDPLNESFRQRAGDLLINTFVVKSENNMGDQRVVDVFFEREKDKPIFAYWWKSVLDGIQKTIK